MPLTTQDQTLIPNDFVIFYCWQDHLDQKLHRYLIRDALNLAISKVQSDLPAKLNCVLRLDSDTSSRAGAVEIADSILRKILTSTVVVGDVTPTLSDPGRNHYYPNPNVMVELGYAARSLGWNRIVCVFNAAGIRPEHLPFDIRHRRLTQYHCGDVGCAKQAAKALAETLVIALRSVIQEIGEGLIDPTLGDAALKHGRDLRLLRRVMASFHRKTVDRFIEAGQTCHLFYPGVFFWEDFNSVVTASNFRFFDKQLDRLVRELHTAWHQAVHYGSNVFFPGRAETSYVLKPELEWDEAYQQTVDSMAEAYAKMPGLLGAFLDHVHAHFPEIDTDETDAIAWKRNQTYIVPKRPAPKPKRSSRPVGRKKRK